MSSKFEYKIDVLETWGKLERVEARSRAEAKPGQIVNYSGAASHQWLISNVKPFLQRSIHTWPILASDVAWCITLSYPAPFYSHESCSMCVLYKSHRVNRQMRFTPNSGLRCHWQQSGPILQGSHSFIAFFNKMCLTINQWSHCKFSPSDMFWSIL